MKAFAFKSNFSIRPGGTMCIWLCFPAADSLLITKTSIRAERCHKIQREFQHCKKERGNACFVLKVTFDDKKIREYFNTCLLKTKMATCHLAQERKWITFVFFTRIVPADD